MDAIRLDAVTKRFNSTLAVDALSARVPVGCIYGFLGPNGAGKTTTLRMLMDILRPDSGHIEILGSTRAADAKARVGYMPEQRGLYGRMKVAAMLAYLGAISGLSDREARRRAGTWLERLDLTSWADRKVQELSRGMQQRLQFAATCVHDPELLILDEPFSGLDPVNLDALKAIVLEMTAEGKTIVLSTHMMDQAQRLCDFIFLVDRGRKVVDGTLTEIRSAWPSNTVRVDLEGETNFVTGLPMVAAVRATEGVLEVELTDITLARPFLAALVARTAVRSFEHKTPSLHEVFVHLVGGQGDA